jgi:hypothetical protein
VAGDALGGAGLTVVLGASAFGAAVVAVAAVVDPTAFDAVVLFEPGGLATDADVDGVPCATVFATLVGRTVDVLLHAAATTISVTNTEQRHRRPTPEVSRFVRSGQGASPTRRAVGRWALAVAHRLLPTPDLTRSSCRMHVVCVPYDVGYTFNVAARKHRLTVTVDHALVEAGNRAVAEGDADSLSGWVNDALAERVARETKLAHVRAAIADYEAEFGVITADEIAAQARADRENAVVVRAAKPLTTGTVQQRRKKKSA